MLNTQALKSMLYFIAGVFIIGIFAIATQTKITDTTSDFNTITATTINTTTLYENGHKIPKPYDKVVCRSTDTGCDVVCTDSDCSDEIQSAIDTVSANGGGVVYLKPGVYPLATAVSIAGKENITIIGSGTDNTILKNYGFQINSNLNGTNIYIKSLTINLNNNSVSGINFANKCTDCGVEKVKIENANSKTLFYGAFCGGYIKDSIFIDGGIGTGTDNLMVSNICDKPLVIDHIYSIKNISAGGGLFTNGGTINTIITNSYFIDYSGNAYAGISIEHQTRNSSNLQIENNYIEKGIGIGVNANAGKDFVITNNIIHNGCINIDGHSSGLYKDNRVKINNNICYNSTYGIMLIDVDYFDVSNNQIMNTNIFNSTFTSDKGGIYLYNVSDGSVSNNQIWKKDCSYCTPYGIKLSYTKNVSLKRNEMNQIATKYAISSSLDYYIDDYTFSSLPSCTTENVLNGKTINYNDGTHDQRCTCISGSWKCVYNDDAYALNSGTTTLGTVQNDLTIQKATPVIYLDDNYGVFQDEYAILTDGDKFWIKDITAGITLIQMDNSGTMDVFPTMNTNMDMGSNNITSVNQVTLSNGGTITGNSTCLILTSPDGTGKVSVCNV